MTTRLHVALRWWSCPFTAVAEAVPRAARILELGCGHGLLSVLLAVDSSDRDILGTDVDGGKIAAAARVAAGKPGLAFAPSAPGDIPAGPWDAVAVVDVLYLIPRTTQRELLLAAAAQLADGGVLVIKEMSPHPAWKARWMRLQEQVAVRVLGITQGDDLEWVAPGEIGEWLSEAGMTVEHRPLDAGYAHPHHLIVARRPVPDQEATRPGTRVIR